MSSESAVLLSGGLDSAVLLASEARDRAVQPVYVSTGLAWEAGEREIVERLLAAPIFAGRARPLAHLAVSVHDVYAPSHWAITGRPPAYDTPDEDVYLHGRNVLLLSKAALFCAARGISRIALGPLAGNPFPDATPAFFDAFARALSLGLDHTVEIATPLSTLHKADVIALGRGLGVPFELTLSCMSPSAGQHCGLCSKCRERHDAFADAGVPDPTPYLHASPREGGASRPG
jgi:7-cyano-7-deazaguanine synthase